MYVGIFFIDIFFFYTICIMHVVSLYCYIGAVWLKLYSKDKTI